MHLKPREVKTPSRTSKHEPNTANEITFFRAVKECLQNCLISPTYPTNSLFYGQGFQPFGWKILSCAAGRHNLQFLQLTWLPAWRILVFTPNWNTAKLLKTFFFPVQVYLWAGLTGERPNTGPYGEESKLLRVHPFRSPLLPSVVFSVFLVTLWDTDL